MNPVSFRQFPRFAAHIKSIQLPTPTVKRIIVNVGWDEGDAEQFPALYDGRKVVTGYTHSGVDGIRIILHPKQGLTLQGIDSSIAGSQTAHYPIFHAVRWQLENLIKGLPIEEDLQEMLLEHLAKVDELKGMFRPVELIR